MPTLTPAPMVTYSDTRIPAVLASMERSETWLARKMNRPLTSVWRVLRGQRPITADFVAQACAALNLPSEVLFVPADIHMRIRENDRASAD